MIESDTVKLLRECDAGIKMGVYSLSDVLPDVKHPSLRRALDECRAEHDKLGCEIRGLLESYHDAGKAPNVIVKSMSHIKTEMKMSLKRSDATIADLITDGCHMGTKSLYRYLNQYKAADEESKAFAKRLIRLEDGLLSDIRPFL